MLTVRNNKLKELPSTISQINSLSIINVVGNQLSMLPAAVASLPNISAIWIAENQVSNARLIILFSKILKQRYVLIYCYNFHSNYIIVLYTIRNYCVYYPVIVLTLFFLLLKSRPLLEFQVKADPSTGDNWLTCVLFPQQGHEVPYEDCEYNPFNLKSILVFVHL